jgi:CBS domain-containing protein
MTVSQIMTKDVISVGPDMGIREVAALLTKFRIHGVPVINENREVVGIITEVDFFTEDEDNIYLPQYASLLKNLKISEVNSYKQKRLLKEILKATAKDIMTKDCICIQEDFSIDKLIKIFKRKKIGMVPVVNKKNILVGVVSIVDIIKLL